MTLERERVESLGPAEKILSTITSMTDHMVHNRPGLVTKSSSNIGVQWTPCTWVQEGPAKVVYTLSKVGKQVQRTRAGVMDKDNTVRNGAVVVGQYRCPSDRNKLFPEVVSYLYRQVADVFKMDNEFVAHWASWAFAQENRDLKTVLAAFLFVQPRCGAPVKDGSEVLFMDDDFRDIAEAMFLIKSKTSMEPKLLERVGDILTLPEVVAINRELGFGKSGQSAILGRYPKAVQKWLAFREANPKMLEGLVSAGMRNTVIDLARRVHYKPQSEKFYEILRWKQTQSKEGHRKIALDKAVKAAESWVGMTEGDICQRIVDTKPGFKRIVGLLPREIGLTRAILAAAIEAGSLSDKDLILISETLETLGLTEIEPFKSRWMKALAQADDQRARNVAARVKTVAVKEALQDAADKATAKALEKASRGLRIYLMVDKSGSMQHALGRAVTFLSKFVGGFPLDRLHVAVFNTLATEVRIQAPKQAAVQHAFQGHTANGGTYYSTAVSLLSKYKPTADEDALFIFIGDQEGESAQDFANMIRRSGISPVAFGFLDVSSYPRHYGHSSQYGTVVGAAAALAIPCFSIDESMFTSDDPYAVTQVFRNLIAATPVSRSSTVVRSRKSLIEEILEVPLLQKPSWAI